MKYVKIAVIVLFIVSLGLYGASWLKEKQEEDPTRPKITSDREVLEVGYLFRRAYWHQGYATEAARACKTYAFEVLKADEVCSIIRDTNTASWRVALRNGMTPKDNSVKHYKGVDMPHIRYVAVREDGSETAEER